VTMQYLAGELSAWLQRLQAVSGPSGAAQFSELRYEVEACPRAWLAPAMRRAVVLADGLCWDRSPAVTPSPSPARRRYRLTCDGSESAPGFSKTASQ
jgi:hypothetical protein